MPGFVKTEADEKKWRKAKDIVAKQRKKTFSQFEDSDYALANKIFHNMSASADLHALATSKRPSDMPTLLGRLQRILKARTGPKVGKEVKNAKVSASAKPLVEALSSLAAASGQAIATLRATYTSDMSEEEVASLTSKVSALAAALKEIR